MSYPRVIPRDLFNEASLLKCYGQLYLELSRLGLEDSLSLDDHTAPFHVAQSPADGSIVITNVVLTLNGTDVPLWRPLNARKPYPLWADIGAGDAIEVFNSDGSLSGEMLSFLKAYAP